MTDIAKCDKQRFRHISVQYFTTGKCVCMKILDFIQESHEIAHATCVKLKNKETFHLQIITMLSLTFIPQLQFCPLFLSWAQWRLQADFIGWAYEYFNKLINFQKIVSISSSECSSQGQVFHCKLRHQGCSFTGMNRCSSFPYNITYLI